MRGAFAGQVAWVTGAGSGIGKAIALELARQGADVALSGRRRDRLEEVAREIAQLGRRASVAPVDVCDEAAVHAAAAAVVGELGRIDVVVANAGFSVAGKVADLTADDWRRQLETNVVGVASTVRAALPQIALHRGRVALVGSVSAYLSAPRMGPYSASKAAVRAIGDTLTLELAGSGATCTQLHPGFVESEIGRVDNRGNFDASRSDRRPRMLMWTSERAARVCVRAIEHRERELVFTGHGKIGAFIARHVPSAFFALMSTDAVRSRAAGAVKDAGP